MTIWLKKWKKTSDICSHYEMETAQRFCLQIDIFSEHSTDTVHLCKGGEENKDRNKMVALWKFLTITSYNLRKYILRLNIEDRVVFLLWCK